MFVLFNFRAFVLNRDILVIDCAHEGQEVIEGRTLDREPFGVRVDRVKVDAPKPAHRTVMPIVTKLMERRLEIAGPRRPFRFVRTFKLTAAKDRSGVGFFLDQRGQKIVGALLF